MPPTIRVSSTRICVRAWWLLLLLLCASAALLAHPHTTHADNTGLIGYWSFDEGTSTKATDFPGRGNTGTLTSSPTWTDGKGERH